MEQKEQKTSGHDYSVEEILAETRSRFSGKSYAELIGEAGPSSSPKPAVSNSAVPESPTPKAAAEPPKVSGNDSSPQSAPAAIHTQPSQPRPEKRPASPKPEIERPTATPVPEAPSEPVRTSAQEPDTSSEEESSEILYDIGEDEEEVIEQKPRKKGFFQRMRERRKEKQPSFEAEEDIYYGLQLKGIEEYRKGYNEEAPQPLSGPTATFSYLFDDTREEEVDTEIAGRFSKIHEQRERQISQLSRETGESYESPFDQPSFSKPIQFPTPAPKQRPQVPSGTVEFKVQRLHPVEESQVKTTQARRPADSGAHPSDDEIDRLIRDRAAMLVDEQSKQAPNHAAPVGPRPGAEGSGAGRRAEIPSSSPQKQTWEDISSYSPGTEHLGLESVLKEAQETAPPIQEEPPVQTAPPLSRKEQKKVKIRELMDAAPQYRVPGDVQILEIGDISSALEHELQPYMAETSAESRQEKTLHTEPSSRKGFSLLGDDEEENDPSEEFQEEPDELDDYQDPSDAPSIIHDLNANTRKLLLRLMVTAIATILLLGAGLICERGDLLPVIQEYDFNALAYLIINLSFLVIALGFSFPTILNGLKGLFRLHANSDSSIAVASLAVFLQSTVMLFQPDIVMTSQVHLYSSLAVAGLFLNTAGKLSLVRRIHRNFHFVISPEPKSGVMLYDDHNTSLQLAKGCVADTPVIAYQKKVKFFRRFLNLSNKSDPSEQASQMIAPIAFILSLLLCAAVMFLSKDFFAALAAFTASACISTPSCNMLAANLPVSRLCKLARRCGAMLVGYPSIERFSNVNAVMLDAKDLFPKGTVILNGIKTFGDERIDDAIVDATALMCAAGGPLSDLFEQIIKSHHDMLPKIDNLSYEDDRGVVGWVSGRRILVGNRDLLREHSIDPPSRDYEKKYLLGGKQIVYLASGGNLVAMFIISYNSDKRRTLELQRMENSGISLIVRTCDPNITPEFLAQCFRLDVLSVRVLPERLGNVYQKLVKSPEERADAFFASKGRPTAMMRLLTACVRQKGNVSVAVALQYAAVILGFVLVAFLSCYSGLGQLSTTALLLYEIFWAVVILLIPKLRKF